MSPVAPKRFRRERGEKYTEYPLVFVRTLRVVRGSKNSKDVFIENLTSKGAKTAKVCMSVSPCSYRSRCSRFMILSAVESKRGWMSARVSGWWSKKKTCPSAKGSACRSWGERGKNGGGGGNRTRVRKA